MRLVLPVLCTLAACGGAPVEDSDDLPGHAGNILVLISDDIGKDRTGAYALAGETYTSAVDGLAAEGLRFDNAYSSPTCSPSRATLMTGRYSTRTGVGRWIFPNTESWDLHTDEITLAEMLALSPHGYTSAAVGKWHMVRFTREDAPMHPLQQGFAHHRGALANPRDAVQEGNTPRSYVNWEKNVDGQVEWSETYMTTDTVDEAIGMMGSLPEPWFLWVAFNAAHTPLHVPPDALNPMGVTVDSGEHALYDADTLAFDLELQRLLDAIDPEVREELTIVYLADNGTPDHAIREPYNPLRGKATVFEGGVNVPMIVTGPHVAEPGTHTDALVSFADLFPTLAELADVDAEALTYPSGERAGQGVALDGHSFAPVLADPEAAHRDFLFTETFYPNGPGPYHYRDRTVRDAEYKLRRYENADGVASEWFFRIGAGIYDEGDPLDLAQLSADEEAALARLREELDRLAAGMALEWTETK